MGCGKICQAKKQAAAAQNQANQARNAKPPAGPTIPGVPKITGSSVKVTTVGHILGVHEKKNALTPWEVITVLGAARGNSKITRNSVAAGLITPIQAAFGTYIGLKVAQLAFNITKPAVRMAVQINGIITFNFAMLPELLADIALLILTIFVGLAPIFLSLLKNIFLSIPIDIGIMTTYQLNELKTLIELSKIEIKNTFLKVTNEINAYLAIMENNKKALEKAILGGVAPTGIVTFVNVSTVINNYIQNNDSPYVLSDILDVDVLKQQFIEAFGIGMNSCKEIILEALAADLNKLSIDILDLEDVSTFDIENKNKVKQISNGLSDAVKRIELLQAGEILKRQFSVSGMPPSQDGQIFDDNDLAIAAAENMLEDLTNLLDNITEKRNVDVDEIFLYTFNEEVEKKKAATLGVREDIAAIDLAQELILQNKNSFILSMINKLDQIVIDKTDVIQLDPCYEQSITNDFNTLKSVTLTQQISFINTSVVENTSQMISLKDAVYASSVQSVIDDLIVVDSACQNSFGSSVCESIDRFKRKLYSEMKKSIESGEIPIDELPVPDGIDKYELKKMLNILLDEVKKKLIKQGMDIIVEEIIPCKSCKPCEDMVADMNIYVTKTVQNSKNNIIKYLQGYIMNSGRDWTITDAVSVTNQKNYLIGQLTMALQKPSGELQLVEDMLYRIQMEEDELLKNVRTSLQAV